MSISRKVSKLYGCKVYVVPFKDSYRLHLDPGLTFAGWHAIPISNPFLSGWWMSNMPPRKCLVKGCLTCTYRDDAI